jgi:NADPH2:quinone reductase
MGMMRAIEITEFGGVENLRVSECALPEPKPGELLIRVHAAGVNRPDVLQRMGLYAVPVGASPVLGLEVAGEVVGGDLRDTGFKLGDTVCALVQGGGYAEYCVAPIGQCLPVPVGFSMIEAASLPETYFTVWQNVFQGAALAEGESLLVHGGSSGIGVAAIQIAKALGHTVFATVGTQDKLDAVLELGADAAINYKTENFSQRVKELTQGRGVDVILDMVAAKYLQANVDCLADDGRIALIALLGGAKAELDMGQMLRRRLSIRGSTLRPRSIAVKAEIARQLVQQVWPLLEGKQIRPVVYKVLKLEEVAQSHQLMESGQHIGKIVLSLV